MLSDAGRTGKAMGERKISRDATARSSPRGDPVGQRGMTWHPPSTGFPSGTASLKSPRWSGAIPKEDTASQGMLQAGRCHLPDHSRICTEDDLGPPASALSRWHPNVTDPRGAAPWWPHGKTSTNVCPSWGETRFRTALDITPCSSQATERMQTPACPIAKASCHAVLKATARFPSTTSPITCRDVLYYQPHPGPLPLHLGDVWPKHLSHRNIKFPTKPTLPCLRAGRKLQAHLICVYIYILVFAGAMDPDSPATGQPVALAPCLPCGPPPHRTQG